MTLQELGQAIREKRTAANLSIDDVAGRIKISARILKSIEEGSLVGLPHAVYTKSFIRAFGLMVGYDAAELTKHLDELFPPESLDETRNEPGPRTRTIQVSSGSGKNIAILLFVVVLLALLAAGGWYVAKNYGDSILDLVKTPFSAITAPASDSDGQRQAVSKYATPFANNGSAAPEHSPSATGARPAETGTQARAPGESSQAAPQTSSATIAAPASAGVAASGPSNAAAQNAQASGGKKSLRIVAEDPCWVSFRTDGVKGREYILQPKEELSLAYENSLEITFGNAGGVTMEHNGRNIGKPGRPGQRVVLSFPRPDE